MPRFQDILSRKGKSVELFGAYEPFASGLSQWLIQLYGESCGKDGKGLFPASAQFSTDLHSLGQYIQEGQRILCETVLDFADTGCSLTVPVLAATMTVWVIWKAEALARSTALP